MLEIIDGIGKSQKISSIRRSRLRWIRKIESLEILSIIIFAIYFYVIYYSKPPQFSYYLIGIALGFLPLLLNKLEISERKKIPQFPE